MKIGISLAGISYITTGCKRDFRDTYKNFYETIYNPLAKEHTVSVYTTTYPNEFQDEFLKIYNPIKSQFLSFENSHPRINIYEWIMFGRRRKFRHFNNHTIRYNIQPKDNRFEHRLYKIQHLVQRELFVEFQSVCMSIIYLCFHSNICML